MSGTSLDGIDGVLVSFDSNGCHISGTVYLPYSDNLREDILGLNQHGTDEIARAMTLGNQLAELYAQCVQQLLTECACRVVDTTAIGCHGQTVRHHPELGYTVQIGNAAMLAELTGITVVADFRSRDIAAGGQGAPLVPAFHQAMFADSRRHRVLVNIGGISNLTNLPLLGKTTGFDCCPGNILLDGWASRHLHTPYDADGAWAASGKCIPQLLERLLAEPFFAASPPKSTGRDTFNLAWLESRLQNGYKAADVQTTLLELTAKCIADAIAKHSQGCKEVYLCGGGAHNLSLVARLKALLPGKQVQATDTLGIPADWVEAAAFAWLAKQTIEGKLSNLPEVTGARGARILGAIYPA